MPTHVFHFSKSISSAKIQKYTIATERGMVSSGQVPNANVVANRSVNLSAPRVRPTEDPGYSSRGSQDTRYSKFTSKDANVNMPSPNSHTSTSPINVKERFFSRLREREPDSTVNPEHAPYLRYHYLEDYKGRTKRPFRDLARSISQEAKALGDKHYSGQHVFFAGPTSVSQSYFQPTLPTTHSHGQYPHIELLHAISKPNNADGSTFAIGKVIEIVDAFTDALFNYETFLRTGIDQLTAKQTDRLTDNPPRNTGIDSILDIFDTNDNYEAETEQDAHLRTPLSAYIAGSEPDLGAIDFVYFIRAALSNNVRRRIMYMMRPQPMTMTLKISTHGTPEGRAIHAADKVLSTDALRANIILPPRLLRAIMRMYKEMLRFANQVDDRTEEDWYAWSYTAQIEADKVLGERARKSLRKMGVTEM
ncbi:hypothetical protein K470DRAFT_272715 [Piedraia hortae CBS 480.64]|uniref:Uncharacterized protein n=1 Tax=Piedraia hortae CBS 480.64 TaxID=1314780 RepID=A0A6A7BTT5_9PEZI|nr:hypothetical protein K470DRAFT_272715 [Piedraia hortae CBS 480.64]